MTDEELKNLDKLINKENDKFNKTTDEEVDNFNFNYLKKRNLLTSITSKEYKKYVMKTMLNFIVLIVIMFIGLIGGFLIFEITNNNTAGIIFFIIISVPPFFMLVCICYELSETMERYNALLKRRPELFKEETKQDNIDE